MVAKFGLNDGSVLAHYSIRKFGSIKLVSSNELEVVLSKLGVEPLSKQFTLEHFNELLLKKQKSVIKSFLMDQSLIAGIGNIYAIEVLYLSGIDPQRKIISFSSPEIKKLYNQIKKVLQLAVEKKGSTVDNYVHVEGSGGYQNLLTVYGKKVCPKGHEVKKINLGGRGTYYCPECQR